MARLRPTPSRSPAGIWGWRIDMTSDFAPRSYSQLAVASADDLMFGVAQRPVRRGFGLEIGAGKVFPEVNFTLPAMSLTDETWPEVCATTRKSAARFSAEPRASNRPGSSWSSNSCRR
jgi:hypothetical protein